MTVLPPKLATAANEVPVSQELVFHSVLSTMYGTNQTGVLQYIWNFGDGSSMTGIHLESPAHTYAEPAVYTVTLNVIYLSSQVRFFSLTVTALGEFARLCFCHDHHVSVM